MLQPPGPLKLYYFLTGFLVNAIVHRLHTGQVSDLLYPVMILVCTVSLILLGERSRI